MAVVLDKLKNILYRYKTLVSYLNSTIILFFIGLVTSFVSYRYIEPNLLGIWVTMVTFEVYFTFIRLGIPNGMNRELPYALGSGDRDRAMRYAATTMAFSFFCALIVLIVAPAIIYSSNLKFSSSYYWMVFAVVMFRMVTEPYATYLSGTFRTNDNFDKLSKIQYIQGIIRISSVLLVVFFRFKGYVLMQFIIALTNLMQLHIVRPFHIKPKFIWAAFKDLFRIGFPIFIISYLSSTISTLPRLFLIKNATSLEMGLLSPVLMLLSSAAIIPTTIANYLYPKFSFSLGKYNNPNLLKIKMMYIFGISFLISIGISLTVYFLIDYLIVIFPKYLASADYIKYACLAVLFIPYTLGTTLPIVLKKWNWLWAYTILYGVIQVFSLIILNKYIEDKLKVVVFSISTTSFVLLLFSVVMTFFITRSAQMNVQN